MTFSNSSPMTIKPLISNLLGCFFPFLGSWGASVIFNSGLGALATLHVYPKRVAAFIYSQREAMFMHMINAVSKTH